MIQSSLPEITVATDAIRVNEIMNHPAVNPWIAEDSAGPIDMAWKMTRPDVVTVLLGEFGAFTAYRLLPGVYEFHTQILPEGRGKWGFSFFRAGLEWIFTRTDAYEVFTRVPETHLAAVKAARLMGLRLDFKEDTTFLYRGQDVSSLIYSMRIQEWASAAPEMEETGRWLHERIEERTQANGIAGSIWPASHPDGKSHNRYLGVAYRCALRGQLAKGVLLYNRWLLASHVNAHLQAKVLSLHPPKVWLYHAELTMLADGDIDIHPA